MVAVRMLPFCSPVGCLNLFIDGRMRVHVMDFMHPGGGAPDTARGPMTLIWRGGFFGSKSGPADAGLAWPIPTTLILVVGCLYITCSSKWLYAPRYRGRLLLRCAWLQMDVPYLFELFRHIFTAESPCTPVHKNLQLLCWCMEQEGVSARQLIYSCSLFLCGGFKPYKVMAALTLLSVLLHGMGQAVIRLVTGCYEAWYRLLSGLVQAARYQAWYRLLSGLVQVVVYTQFWISFMW